jgi:DNA-binding FadR family transcriptional regulator
LSEIQPLPRVGKPALLSVAVTEELAGRILRGEWRAGERIPSEPELGAQLGVSRSVVRDAVRTLAARGLVDVRQGLGTVVREPDDAAYADSIGVLLIRSALTVGDLARARAALDVRLAELAASARDEADLAKLASFHADLLAGSTAGDWRRCEVAHLSFHLAILDATHLPALSILLGPLQRIILATSQPADLDDPASWRVESETAVLHGIRTGAAAAREAMEAHYWFLDDPAYADLHARPLAGVLGALP